MTRRRCLAGLAFVVTLAYLLASPAKLVAQEETCQTAYSKLKEDTYKQARDAYAELLVQNKDLTCAKVGLDFVRVFTLADLGLYDEARTQLAEVVKQHPAATVPEDLDYLVGGKITPWRWVTHRTDPWWLPAGEVLALLVIVPLAFIALRTRIIPWTSGFRQYPIRLDVQAFDDGATGLVLGKGLAAKLEEEIRRIGERKGIRMIEVQLVATPIQSLAVPANVQAATPQLMIISQLIEWALPQKVITLTGFLQKPGERGAGLTLALAESWSGNMFANQMFWQADYDPVPFVAPPPDPAAPASTTPEAEPFYALTLPASDWVCWTLNYRYGR